ncbi:MAG: phytoene desaturase [Myxococcales bacterium]|nr:phytoene desaturase [Myxococcales bacterium]
MAEPALARKAPASASAAVVGSGFGGLAAAIRLQAAGVKTTLFESRDKPGGRAYVYEDEGFTFDAGPTVITAHTCLEELYELAGEKLAEHVDLLPVHPFYRLLWSDGATLDYDGDEAFMDAEVKRLCPKDLEGYRRFIDYSRRVFHAGYENLAATPFLRFRDMVRVAPQLARLRADRTVYGAVAKYVKDEHLRQALSFHALLIGGNPFETSAIYTLIPFLERKWGVFFPRGGTGALVRELAALFERLGGQLRLSSPVERVRVEPDGRHTVTSGQTTNTFDVVVSNADLHHTYGTLYNGVPGAARRTQRLEKMEWSMSLFVLYFGTKKKYDNLAHHTVIFGPRYRELLDDIFHGQNLPDDFSLYLHAPTVTDPSLGPPGCETFYVLAPVPHLGNANVDWEAEKERYADRILAYLERWLPDLRANLVTKRTFTPRDFQSTLHAFNGSAFSVAPRLRQSAYFRPHNRDGGIPGLYIVGAGTHPGAGVPGVINSAKATAHTVLSDLGFI